MGRRSNFFGKFKWRSTSPSPSPSPRIERRNSITGQPIAIPTSQTLTVPEGIRARPHSSHAGSSSLETYEPPLGLSPLIAGGNVTTVLSDNHGFPSSADVQGSSYVSGSTLVIQILDPQSEPSPSEHPAPPSACAPQIQTSTYQVPALAETDERTQEAASTPSLDAIQPLSHSSMVWAKAVEIAEKKLSEINLPPLDLTNFNPTAGKDIYAVIKGLNSLQEDDKKKRWSYTWRGKKVIVVERLGKILKSMEKYSKIVDTAIQANPEVSALVWAGIWAIIRVCILYPPFFKC